jgi:hypothetical protein
MIIVNPAINVAVGRIATHLPVVQIPQHTQRTEQRFDLHQSMADLIGVRRWARQMRGIRFAGARHDRLCCEAPLHP